MRRWIMVAAILLLALSVSAVAFAQGTNPTPPSGTVPSLPGTPDGSDEDDENEEATATPLPEGAATPVPDEEGSETLTTTVASTLTAAIIAEAPQAYITVDVTGGFALDPFFVSVNGGGPIDASTLDPSCSGYITERPRLTINWDGTAAFAELFLYSDHNPSLVVQTPDGSYICNDDTNDLVRDPTIEVTNPPKGQYKIWVGNIDNRGLIPVVAVLTSRTEINTGTFDMGTFVQRPPVRELLLRPADNLLSGGEVQSILVEKLASATDATAIVPDTTVTTTQAISGGLPGFLFPTAPASPFSVCTGLVDTESAYVINVAEGVESLNVFAESNVDSTLLVIQPDGLSICTDEAPDGINRNPHLILHDLQPGNYAVLVGGVQVQEPSEALVTITTNLDEAPVMLSAEQLAGDE